MKKVSEMDTYLTNISLYFDENTCTSCGLCEILCPEEAIELGPSGAIARDATELSPLSVDEEECALCGVCDAICPFGAFRLEINGEHETPVVDLEALPNLLKKIEYDPDKCEMEKKCVEACPLDAITIENDGWEIDMDLCATCPWCQDVCPNDAITVEKIIDGEIEIDTSKCPGGCADCLEICPVNAIYEPEREKPWEMKEKIAVDERYCIYCGACANACPVEGAIKISREEIRVEETESLLWDRTKDTLREEVKSVEEE